MSGLGFRVSSFRVSGLGFRFAHLYKGQQCLKPAKSVRFAVHRVYSTLRTLHTPLELQESASVSRHIHVCVYNIHVFVHVRNNTA